MQRGSNGIVEGVDDAVKTIYSPLPLLIEHNHFAERLIVKSAPAIAANRPIKGLVAFVCALPMTAAMKPLGGSTRALHLSLRSGYQLDRDEDQMHPGEGGATT
jgi:hypothetical protein